MLPKKALVLEDQPLKRSTTMSAGNCGASSTRQVNVRLWGSGVGLGTSRSSLATVPTAFMTVATLPTLLYHTQPTVKVKVKVKVKGGPSPGRKRKLSHHQQQQQQYQHRQQPPLTLDGDPYHIVYNGNGADNGKGHAPSLDSWPAIDFDSETGKGTRPEYSRLRPRQAVPDALPLPWATGSDAHSVSPPENCVDSQLPTSRHDAVEAVAADHVLSEEYKAADPTRGSAGQLFSFWKALEDCNYFQPLSKVAQHMDDLYLRGGDYESLLSPAQGDDGRADDAVLPSSSSSGVAAGRWRGRNGAGMNGATDPHEDRGVEAVLYERLVASLVALPERGENVAASSSSTAPKGRKIKAKRKGESAGDAEADAASFGSGGLLSSKSDSLDALNGVDGGTVCGQHGHPHGVYRSSCIRDGVAPSGACSSSAPPSSNSSSSPSPGASLHGLKTLVELAEAGVLRDFDIGLSLGPGDIPRRPSAPSPHLSGSGAQLGRYRSYLSEQVREQWADDAISLLHREHVALLVEVEKELNERIAHLRRVLNGPEASTEDAHWKRQDEVNRSVIGRLVKIKKKEKLQAQMQFKVQQRIKSRAAVAVKAATDENFVE